MKHEDCCNNTTIPYISLFSGYEGIGLGLKRIFGRNLRTIAYCEREAFPCANLVDKIEKGQLDAAPIFTDVHTFPWKQYYPFMANGIMSFGFPCQPVSFAGKRKVTEDDRWLFDVCADGIEILKPGIIFAENVEGLLSAKMPTGNPVIAHIFERLEKIHYTVEAGLFSAAEVGAPHRRKRVFILAYSGSTELNRISESTERRENSSTWISGIGMADSSKPGPQNTELETIQPAGRRNERRATAKFCGSLWPARPGEAQYEWEEPRVLANASQQLQYGARDTWPAGRGESTDQSERKTKSFVGGAVDGPAKTLDQTAHELDSVNKNRCDRLRLLGNGVVPATAEKAFITLMNRITSPGRNTEPVETQMELF